METVDLLRDYIVQLRRYGHIETVMKEIPAADGLTTAYLFQGNAEHFSSFIPMRCVVGSALNFNRGSEFGSQ